MLKKKTLQLLQNIHVKLILSVWCNVDLMEDKQGGHKILEWNMLRSFRKLGFSHRSWILQKDNDPKHTEKKTNNGSEQTLDYSEVSGLIPIDVEKDEICSLKISFKLKTAERGNTWR